MTAGRGTAAAPGGDSPPIRLLLSAGRGPAECAWAVAELARRLEAEAAATGVRTRRREAVAGERPRTFRSLVIELADPPRPSGAPAAAEALAEAWTGTLCWQAPSPWRRGTGRKNAAVTDQWRLHDQLVRGRPVRTERPDGPAPEPPGAFSRRRCRPGAGR